jgi:predicted DNA-binding transcriptional regulator AlpA
MKNAYKIEEVMELYGIESRTTFWRRRKANKIPPPDIDEAHPRWFRATLAKHIPNLNTNS